MHRERDKIKPNRTFRIYRDPPFSTFVNFPLDILYDCRDYARMSSHSVELTRAEWPVIKVVWEMEPCTAPAVQERLAKATGWTYSTVRTLMDRMVAKGVLKAKKEGKNTIYQSALTRRQAQRGELFYALKHAFNGALAPMVQCLLESKDLDEEELKKIEALIQEGKKRQKEKK
jgi:predicted transcriptional regulator